MRTGLDAHRSLARYLALLLPENWDVFWQDEQGTMERPYATIEDTTTQEVVVGGTLAVRDATQGFAINAFPEPHESDPYESRAAAEGIAETIFQGFQIGGVDGARPKRVPLYDYEAAPVDEPSKDRRDPDYLRIVDFDIRALQSPSNERLFSVVATLRVQWSRAGLPEETGVTATDVRTSFDAS